MAIPSSGTLRLRGTIGAEFGYTSTYAQLNKKFGSYAGKAAGAVTRMGDFFGVSAFVPMDVTSSKGSGTQYGKWRVYKFTERSYKDFTVNSNPTNQPLQILAIGGGGSGGIHGGGGAAGQLLAFSYTPAPGVYQCYAGARGAGLDGNPMSWGSTYGRGNDGTSSVFRTSSGTVLGTANGGVGGGGRKSTGTLQTNIDGKDGPCGSGGAAWYGNGSGGSATSLSHGNGTGGIDSPPYVSGGGGGVRGSGTTAIADNTSNSKPGNGGVGYQWAYDGAYYGGGGGGGCNRQRNQVSYPVGKGDGGSGIGGSGAMPNDSSGSMYYPVSAGTNYTGSGGGGGGGPSSTTTNSGAGGHGAVVIAVQTTE